MSLTVLSINNYHYRRGGSDSCFLELNRMFREHGHTVLALSTQSDRNEPAQGAHRFIEPNEIGRPGVSDVLRFHFSPRSRRALRELLKERRPGVAHLHIYYGQLTSSVLGPLRDAGVPIVHTLHEYKLACPVYRMVRDDHICEDCHGGKFWKALSRRCNRGSLARTLVSVTESYVSRLLGDVRLIDRFIAPSHFMRKKMIEHGLPAERVVTVYNYVDTASLEPSHEPGSYFLYFGRLERLKGLHTLVDAALATEPPVPLKIAGEGEALEEIQAKVARRPGSQVSLVGYQRGEALHDLIRGALAVVLPSEWYENCPMVVLEAFALGRPVIGARIGGIPELISHGEDGWLFEPGDADGLRACLDEAASDPRRAAEMGRAGRRKMEAEFDAHHHYERVRAVYGELLSSPVEV